MKTQAEKQDSGILSKALWLAMLMDLKESKEEKNIGKPKIKKTPSQMYLTLETFRTQ